MSEIATPRIVALEVQEVSPAETSPQYLEIGGPYEANPWMKSERRMRAVVTFEWAGEFPEEILTLVRRAKQGA